MAGELSAEISTQRLIVNGPTRHVSVVLAGTQGPAGPQGPAGADGTQGVDGAPGADGAPGMDGFGFALSNEVTPISVATNVVRFRMPQALTLSSVRASLSEPSTSGIVTVDINQDGVSILSTKLTIDANEKTSTTAAVPAVISTTSLTDDAEISFDIDTAGTNARGLKVWLIQ